MQAQGWSPANPKPVTLIGATVSQIEADAERKACSAYRIAFDGGIEVYRRLAGQWICTYSGPFCTVRS